jgi:hypothetical protein
MWWVRRSAYTRLLRDYREMQGQYWEQSSELISQRIDLAVAEERLAAKELTIAKLRENSSVGWGEVRGGAVSWKGGQLEVVFPQGYLPASSDPE